ncbi:MAG: helix-turn-helix transcriptional regulator [Bacteroidota bacterium]|nr:helix-turn-helix transcriptional regulator [Bacteroidota bacterium]
MSYFGKNIRKIRIAKNMNQTEFAELFDLKRTALGSYEEGRAEAKTDTLINIAKYFKISLDQLLRKEITVNEIFHFTNDFSVTEKSEVPLIDAQDCYDFVRYPHKYYSAGVTLKLSASLILDKVNAVVKLPFDFRAAGCRFSKSDMLFVGDYTRNSEMYIGVHQSKFTVVSLDAEKYTAFSGSNVLENFRFDRLENPLSVIRTLCEFR